MLKNVVRIPRTNNVFLRDSIVGVTEAHATGGFHRLSITIIGIGFEKEIQTDVISGDEINFYDEDYSHKRYKQVLADCPIWHAEVVKAIFGDEDGDRQLGCN